MGRSAHRRRSKTSCGVSRTGMEINRLVEKRPTLPHKLCLSSTFHGRAPRSDPAVPPCGRAVSQATVAEGEGTRWAELRRAQAHDARPQAPYGLRGSALPQYRLVLGAQGGDVHDAGGRVHAQLRVLRGRAWDAVAA